MSVSNGNAGYFGLFWDYIDSLVNMYYFFEQIELWV